jgi:ribose transport system substrate-binding protein
MDLAKGGNMKGIVADLPYELGRTLGNMSGLAVLDKEAPAFVTVPAIKIKKDNLAAAWLESLNREVPAEIAAALQ